MKGSVPDSIARPAAPAARWHAFAGAVLAAGSVALSAYASHGAEGAGQAATLQVAAAIAFGHGVALAALSRVAARRLALASLAGLLLGTVLFSGGIVVAHFAEVSARVAPFGGSLLIVSWLAWAADALRG